MKHQIYIAVCPQMFHSDILRQVKEWAMVSWSRTDNKHIVGEMPTVYTSFDMRHESVVTRFNNIYDSDFLIALCPRPNEESDEWLEELKIFRVAAEHGKKIYAVIKMKGEWRMFNSHFVEGKLREIT